MSENKLVSAARKYEDAQHALREAQTELFAEFGFDPASKRVEVVSLRGSHWRFDTESGGVYVCYRGNSDEQCEGYIVSPTRYKDDFCNCAFHVRRGDGGAYTERFVVLSAKLELA